MSSHYNNHRDNRSGSGNYNNNSNNGGNSNKYKRRNDNDSDNSLPYGLNEKSLAPSSMSKVSKDRIQELTSGSSGRSSNQHDKRKQEMEKKRRDDDDVAKSYEDFVSEFDDNNSQGGSGNYKSDRKQSKSYNKFETIRGGGGGGGVNQGNQPRKFGNYYYNNDQEMDVDDKNDNNLKRKRSNSIDNDEPKEDKRKYYDRSENKERYDTNDNDNYRNKSYNSNNNNNNNKSSYQRNENKNYNDVNTKSSNRNFDNKDSYKSQNNYKYDSKYDKNNDNKSYDNKYNNDNTHRDKKDNYKYDNKQDKYNDNKSYDKSNDSFNNLNDNFDENDDNEDFTTLFFGGLYQDVANEDNLRAKLSPYGEILSVRIIQPKFGNDQETGINYGALITFKYHRDALKVRKDFDRPSLQNGHIKLNWAKAQYKYKKDYELQQYQQQKTDSRFNKQDKYNDNNNKQDKHDGRYIDNKNIPNSTSSSTHHHNNPHLNSTHSASQTHHYLTHVPNILVKFPSDHKTKELIDIMAQFVAKEGFPFERSIIERERKNPLFNFLFDTSSDDHYYYSWKVFSLFSGDLLNSWETNPLQMLYEGPRFIPPDYIERTKRESMEKRENYRDRESKERETGIDTHSHNNNNNRNNDKYDNNRDNKYDNRYDNKYDSKHDNKYDNNKDSKYNRDNRQDNRSSYDNRNNNKTNDKYDRDSSRSNDKYDNNSRDNKYDNRNNDRYESSSRDNKYDSRNNEKYENSNFKNNDNRTSSQNDHKSYDDKYDSKNNRYESNRHSNNNTKSDRYDRNNDKYDNSSSHKSYDKNNKSNDKKSDDKPVEKFDSNNNFYYNYNTTPSSQQSNSNNNNNINNNKNSKEISTGVKDDLKDILEFLNYSKEKIKEAMVFCVDHSDVSSSIVDIIVRSILDLPSNQTYVKQKVSKLFLISDILNNCTVHVQNVSSYRNLFESNLPTIFNNLNETYRSIAGRVTAQNFKDKVTQVLNSWDKVSIFSSNYILGLRFTFINRQPNQNQNNINEESKIIDDIDGIPIEIFNSDNNSNNNSKTVQELESFCKLNGLVKGTLDEMKKRISAFDAYVLEEKKMKDIKQEQNINIDYQKIDQEVEEYKKRKLLSKEPIESINQSIKQYRESLIQNQRQRSTLKRELEESSNLVSSQSHRLKFNN